MNFYMIMSQAIGAIFANKMRSALSILGIVIGISSVIVMLAIWEGAKQSILNSFDNAENQISITPKNTRWSRSEESKKTAMEYGHLKSVVNLKLAHEIKERVPGIESIIPVANLSVGELYYDGKEVYANVVPVYRSFFSIKKLEFEIGSSFSEKDEKDAAKKVILGYEAAKQNFWGARAIGEEIYISWSKYIVSGVLKKWWSWSTSYSMFLPFSTAQERFWLEKISKIELYVKQSETLELVKKNIWYYLYKISWAKSAEEINFSLQTNKDAMKQANQIIGKMKMLLGAIGSISLIVWGIWIMNIMLVSVTERTREIGIRKAIGATRRDILVQFLAESIVLSLIGCILALAFSYGVTKLISSFSPEDFQAIISIDVVLLASGVSIFLGIIFGIMPAYKAAKLKIVDTLRYE